MIETGPIFEIDGNALLTWEEFHDEFARLFGLPGFYGRNGNAWIDCMTSLDMPDDGMTALHVEKGSVLTILVSNASRLSAKAPEILTGLASMSAFVNLRRLEIGDQPVLALAYFESESR